MQTIHVFLQFLWRDIYVNVKKLKPQFINYALLFPALFGISFAYLQGNVFFGPGNAHLSTIFFAGTCIAPIIILAFQFTFDLLFDLEGNRAIDYQITILNPRLILLERVLFASFFVFFVSIPYFPMAKLMLGATIDTSNTSWLSLFFILYLGALCCSAYHQFAACVLRQNQITMFWVRVNHILIAFGGLWIPLHVMHTYSPVLGYLARLNPIIYLSEGIKQAIVGGKEFLPLAHCAIALCVFSVIFIVLSWHFFKKRVDHI